MIDRDKWVIALDFLRTKAIYDQYAQKNIPVQFPLRSKEEKRKNDEGEQVDKSTLLTDFGIQLKNGPL